MKKFSELSFGARLGIMVALAAAIVIGGEFLYLGDMKTKNDELRVKVEALNAENARIAPIEQKFKQIKVENEQLEQQLMNLRNIVPEDKEADGFIRMVQEAGVQSGVNIRSFTARPVAQKEFYSEMPFDLSLDGNYYSVLQFFDRMGKLSRISNVSNLAMAPTGRGVRGMKGSGFKYSPNETVVASCTATTFFSREQAGAAKK